MFLRHIDTFARELPISAPGTGNFENTLKFTVGRPWGRSFVRTAAVAARTLARRQSSFDECDVQRTRRLANRLRSSARKERVVTLRRCRCKQNQDGEPGHLRLPALCQRLREVMRACRANSIKLCQGGLPAINRRRRRLAAPARSAKPSCRAWRAIRAGRRPRRAIGSVSRHGQSRRCT